MTGSTWPRSRSSQTFSQPVVSPLSEDGGGGVSTRQGGCRVTHHNARSPAVPLKRYLERLADFPVLYHRGDGSRDQDKQTGTCVHQIEQDHRLAETLPEDCGGGRGEGMER